MSLSFNKTINYSGTSLLGYLLVDPSYINWVMKLPNSCYLSTKDYPFTDIVRKLGIISQQSIESGDKTTFEFIGIYKGEVFTLYDYKNDDQIHIGGNPDLDVDGLVEKLKSMIFELD